MLWVWQIQCLGPSLSGTTSHQREEMPQWTAGPCAPSRGNGKLQQHLQAGLLCEENGLCRQLKRLSLEAIQKGLFAQSSIKERFQSPRSACFLRGAF